MTTVSLTAVEIATLVNGSDDLKAAVLAKYLSENTPELVITDLTEESVPAADDAATETAVQSADAAS